MQKNDVVWPNVSGDYVLNHVIYHVIYHEIA